MTEAGMPVLEVKDLSVSFPVKREFGRSSNRIKRLQAVDAVSFTLEKGTVTGIVGESGCGKTTLARTITRFQKADKGTVLVDGTDVFGLSGLHLRKFRRRIQMIFQNPFASLDPRMTINTIIDEALQAGGEGAEKNGEKRHRAADYLEMTGLDPSMIHKYPHEFSGGQRQRIAIARALATQPSIIIADEPVSSLDVSVAAQILNLFSSLRNQLALSMLFISHDLAVVRFISQHIIIMYQGRVVESGPTVSIFKNPLHPYTINLLRSVPQIAVSSTDRPFFDAVSLKESAAEHYPGCAYSPRCERATEQCRREIPLLLHRDLDTENHRCACFLAGKSDTVDTK